LEDFNRESRELTRFFWIEDGSGELDPFRPAIDFSDSVVHRPTAFLLPFLRLRRLFAAIPISSSFRFPISNSQLADFYKGSSCLAEYTSCPPSLMPSCAPIALFVYNRPLHARATLEALRKNRLAEDSKLYIFADGPKGNAKEEDLTLIDRVRSLVREQPWCGEVEIVESDFNRGLADSIVAGVTRLCEAHGRAIVLEDDLETSPGFLAYMNQALDCYEGDEEVFQISGFNVRMPLFSPPTGFLRVTTSWGWATWQRAWTDFDNNATGLLQRVEEKGPDAFDLDGYSFHVDELQKNVSGELKTWAVRWYASVYLQEGLALYPRRTLVRNLGFDGSGVHCHDDETKYHGSLPLAQSIKVDRQPLVETPSYLRAMQRHYRKTLQLWTGTRFRDRVKRKLKSIFSS